MKASVIIPTFNRAKSLSHVLTCLCKQSFRNFDVYVILKPSLDNSESVLEQFKRVLPLTVIHQSNGGFLDALNEGQPRTEVHSPVFKVFCPDGCFRRPEA